MQSAVASTDGGTLLRIEVSPGSSEDAFPSGFNPWRECLQARVRAPPEDGAANEALLTLVAEHFDVNQRKVAIKTGHTSRRKTLRLQGVREDQVRSLLNAVLP